MTAHHCAGSWIIMKNDASTPRWWHRDLDTQKKTTTKKLPKTPAEFAQLVGLSPNNYSLLFGRGWKSTRWNVAAPALPGEEQRHFLAPQPPIPLERKRKFTPTDGSGGEKKLRERVEGRREKKRESGGKRRREKPDVKSRTVRKEGRPAHILKRLFVKVSCVRRMFECFGGGHSRELIDFPSSCCIDPDICRGNSG